MPVHPVKGRPGCYQWGDSGKVYCGDGAKEKAEAQQRAAYANGYRGKAEMQMPPTQYQYGDDRWWLYHEWEIKDKDTLMTYQDEGRFKIWILLQPYHHNRGSIYDGKITFICTAKYADAKEECEQWIAKNLPHRKGEPQYVRRSMNKDVRDNGKYYSVEFIGLTYKEEAYGRKYLDGYYAAEEAKKNFTTIEDIEVGDVFKFGDGWERFILKSKEIDGYEFDDEDGEIILYKIVFDPYKPSPVSDINGLVKSNVKMVRWNNPYLRMAKRRAGIKDAEEIGLDEFRDGLYHLYVKGKITEEQFIAWGNDYESYLGGDKTEKPPFAAEGSKKPYSVEISRSSNPEKKLMAIFSDKEGNKIKTTHFGQRGASDYTKHGDKERMERYLERHGGGTTTSTKEDWKDPTTAGALSRWILWNKPSLSGSFNDFKRRFGLKGSMKVSKSAEGKLSSAQKSLKKWTKEDWGTKSGKPSTQGEEATGERYLPRKAREALTDKEYARTSAKKRRDTKKGKQFSQQPDDIEEKVAKYRSETFEANDMIKERYFEKQLKKYKDKLSWYNLSQNPSLTPALIEKYINKLDWYELSRNPSLTPALIEKYENKLNWEYLSMNPALTPALIEKYIDELDWKLLSSNPALTPALIEKYENKLNWLELSRNPALFGNLHIQKKAETFEAIEGKGSKARFTDQPDPKIYRDTGLRQKARNSLLKGTKGGDAGEWSARKAQMAATKYRTMYENKYGKGKNPYF